MPSAFVGCALCPVLSDQAVNCLLRLTPVLSWQEQDVPETNLCILQCAKCVLHADLPAQGNRAGRAGNSSYSLGIGGGLSFTGASGKGITILRSRFTRNYASQVCVCVCVCVCV